jgi:hypothetical protein
MTENLCYLALLSIPVAIITVFIYISLVTNNVENTLLCIQVFVQLLNVLSLLLS